MGKIMKFNNYFRNKVNEDYEYEEEESVDDYKGTRMMKELAEMLGTKVINNSINYEGKKINFFSETEKFHIGDKQFETPEEVFDFLKNDESEEEYKVYDELEDSDEESAEDDSEEKDEESFEDEEGQESFNDRNYRHSSTDMEEKDEEPFDGEETENGEEESFEDEEVNRDNEDFQDEGIYTEEDEDLEKKHLNEGLFGSNDKNLKSLYDKYLPVWGQQYSQYYLRLGNGQYVSVKEASSDQKLKAYEIIKSQGEKDKWKGRVAIASTQKASSKIGQGAKSITRHPGFVAYQPASTIKTGGHDTFAGAPTGSANGVNYDEWKAIVDPLMPDFESFLKKQGVIKESKNIKSFKDFIR